MGSFDRSFSGRLTIIWLIAQYNIFTSLCARKNPEDVVVAKESGPELVNDPVSPDAAPIIPDQVPNDPDPAV
jgi:hypothetical protein